MLIVDDILLFPYRGLMWIFKEIHRIAKEEVEGEQQRLHDALVELYMQLETGQISEEEFDERERALLERLDALEAAQAEEEAAQRADEAAAASSSAREDSAGDGTS